MRGARAFNLAAPPRGSRCTVGSQRGRTLSDFAWSTPSGADSVRHDPGAVFRAGMRHHHVANTAFPIGHARTIKPYRVPRTRSQTEIASAVQGAYGHLDELMLYAHVPFCPVRCQFCEYTVVDPRVGKREDVQAAYFAALRTEIELYSQILGGTKDKRVVGFDIGGGTPSMAESREIGRLLDTVHRLYSLDVAAVEISIETTPKIAAAEPAKLRDYYAMGIRRISMGLQTTDFEQAKELGREDANAGREYVQRCVENIRAAGFESFNIDLMYGFPTKRSEIHRAVDPWAQTVRDCMALGPEHITLYRMRYKGTKMEHLQDRVGLHQVNAQAGRAHELLEAGGYAGMVGKNTFSRVEGNSGCSDYLDRRVREAVPYLGFGLGAQSFSHQTLAYNLGAVTKRTSQYLRSVELGRLPVQDLYHLSKEAAAGKMLSVSFYYGGVDLKAFERCFGTRLESMFPASVPFLLDYGLMGYTDGTGGGPGGERLQLTPEGKRHFGGCVAQFYSPAVQQHLLELSGGEDFAEDALVALAAAAPPAAARRRLGAGTGATAEGLATGKDPSTAVDLGRQDTGGAASGLIEKVTPPTVPLSFVGGGEELAVEAPIGASLLDVARANGVELQAVCQGECACSTCHVVLPERHAGAVAPPSEEEQDMVELAVGSTRGSRLACQLRVGEGLRGARVSVPDDMLVSRGRLASAVKMPVGHRKEAAPPKEANHSGELGGRPAVTILPWSRRPAVSQGSA